MIYLTTIPKIFNLKKKKKNLKDVSVPTAAYLKKSKQTNKQTNKNANEKQNNFSRFGLPKGYIA